jgi:hypothetical protein
MVGRVAVVVAAVVCTHPQQQADQEHKGSRVVMDLDYHSLIMLAVVAVVRVPLDQRHQEETIQVVRAVLEFPAVSAEQRSFMAVAVAVVRMPSILLS